MGILQTITTKYKAVRQKSLNKKEFKAALFQAVKDGKLTKQEIEELQDKKVKLGLTDDEIKKIRAEAFTLAFTATKDDAKVTKEEEQELVKIQKHLGLTDIEIQPTKQELARLRLLNEIQQGNLPVLPPASNLVLQKQERVYWIEPATLHEEKVVSRRYEGGSQGVSIRLAKGLSYRVGGHRGRIISQTDIVPVSSGEMVITNKRLIYRSILKSFAIKLDRILDMNLFKDGIKISETNKQKPRLLAFESSGNQDIIGAVLSYAMNNFGQNTPGKP